MPPIAGHGGRRRKVVFGFVAGLLLLGAKVWQHWTPPREPAISLLTEDDTIIQLPQGLRAPMSAMAASKFPTPDELIASFWTLPVFAPDPEEVEMEATDHLAASRGDYQEIRGLRVKLNSALVSIFLGEVDDWWSRQQAPTTKLTPLIEQLEQYSSVPSWKSMHFYKSAWRRLICSIYETPECTAFHHGTSLEPSLKRVMGLTRVLTDTCSTSDPNSPLHSFDPEKREEAMSTVHKLEYAILQKVNQIAVSEFNHLWQRAIPAGKAIIHKTPAQMVKAPWSPPKVFSEGEVEYGLKSVPFINGRPAISREAVQELNALMAVHAEATWAKIVLSTFTAYEQTLAESCHNATLYAESVEHQILDVFHRHFRDPRLDLLDEVRSLAEDIVRHMATADGSSPLRAYDDHRFLTRNLEFHGSTRSIKSPAESLLAFTLLEQARALRTPPSPSSENVVNPYLQSDKWLSACAGCASAKLRSNGDDVDPSCLEQLAESFASNHTITARAISYASSRRASTPSHRQASAYIFQSVWEFWQEGATPMWNVKMQGTDWMPEYSKMFCDSQSYVKDALYPPMWLEDYHQPLEIGPLEIGLAESD